MTIASEITRLQGAKSSAKASIISKGVNVPDNASVADYHTYIDQIETGLPVLTSGLKLYNNPVSNTDDTPRIYGLVSFKYNGKLYGCCISSLDRYSSTGASTYDYALYHWIKADNTDVSYTYTEIRGPGEYIGSKSGTASMYIKGDMVRAYFYEWETVSGGGYTYGVYKFDWNLTTNSCTASLVGKSQTPTSLFDIDGYTQITESLWVQSATGNRIDDDAYIYLTLK